MGVFADKDYRSVIEKTAHFADQILTIQTPDNVRALPAGELAEAVSEYNPNVQAMHTIADAVEKAFELVRRRRCDHCVWFSFLYRENDGYCGEHKKFQKVKRNNKE